MRPDAVVRFTRSPPCVRKNGVDQDVTGHGWPCASGGKHSQAPDDVDPAQAVASQNASSRALAQSLVGCVSADLVADNLLWVHLERAGFGDLRLCVFRAP